MKIGFRSIDERLHPRLAAMALKMSAESPVREYLARGEGYVVRINERHPTPALRGIYFLFDGDGDIYIVSPEVAREMNERHIAEFGTTWNNYTD